MQKFSFYLLLGLSLAISSVIVLTKVYEPILIDLACVGCLVGVGLVMSTLLIKWGEITPKVYRFIHLYNYADSSDRESVIVRQLTHKDVTQLEKDTGAKLREIFRHTPTLHNVVDFIMMHKTPFVEVRGYVYASDENEAIEILEHECFDGSIVKNEDQYMEFIY